MTDVSTQFASLRRVARVAQGVLKDAVAPTRPLTLDDVPASAADVTPEWATAAVCSGTAARVIAVRREPVSDGTSGRSRLHLTYEGPADDVAELPATVFVKDAPSFGNRMQVGITGAIWAETRFYRDVRPLIPDLRAPRGYFGASDRSTGRALVLLEDMDRTRSGVTYGDIRTVYTTRAMAESLVDNLAILHGSFLGSPRLESELRWIITSKALQVHLNAAVDVEKRTLVGFDRARGIIPAALHGRRNDVQPGLMRALELDALGPLGIVHTDVHSGNWFAQDGERMGLYDWAALARGQGSRDLAYALMSALTIEDRRTWERSLVELYAERVGEVSGIGQDPETVWTAYRRQTLHGFGYWLYTLGQGMLQPSMQPDEVSRINIERMAQAVLDLETFEALSRA
ncbi:phosphotransferase [Georgenia sp. SYP-B2076]|uniref:phosphotransferase n=1 Tax=Georgenia sp. SYP-B2076 TaxID=2495881 RepID=UPI000F8C5800|nr:phosphotransferase [Georgenia sp. SYP-B2076]